MVILIVSLVASLVAGGLFGFFFGPLGGVLPALVVFPIVYFLLARRVNAQMQAGMGMVQKEMQRGATGVPRAIEMLKSMREKFKNQQFFAKSSIDAQIGSILFMQQKYKEAKPYLDESFVRAWNAQVMRAVLRFKKKDLPGVDEILERAAKYNGKQGLLWSTWAFMHAKTGNRTKAIELMVRGKTILKDDDKLLSDNLLALQNGKKMKLKGYGEAWYQFQLEKHPLMKQAERGSVRFARN